VLYVTTQNQLVITQGLMYFSATVSGVCFLICVACTARWFAIAARARNRTQAQPDDQKRKGRFRWLAITFFTLAVVFILSCMFVAAFCLVS
jgi:hypothetical protein